MSSTARWAFSFTIVFALAGIALVACAGSAAAATISGTVTDRGNTPVPDATVTLYKNNQEFVTTNNPTLTGIDGHYAFPGLPAGNYSIHVEKDGYTYSGTTGLESNDVTLNLPIPGYTFTPGTPTPMGPVITVLPTPTPTPTPSPAPTPKPRASNTPVPLPTLPPAPGFEALLAAGAISLVLAAKWYVRR